jgi:hypothetical protein
MATTPTADDCVEEFVARVPSQMSQNSTSTPSSWPRSLACSAIGSPITKKLSTWSKGQTVKETQVLRTSAPRPALTANSGNHGQRPPIHQSVWWLPEC